MQILPQFHAQPVQPDGYRVLPQTNLFGYLVDAVGKPVPTQKDHTILAGLGIQESLQSQG